MSSVCVCRLFFFFFFGGSCFFFPRPFFCFFFPSCCLPIPKGEPGPGQVQYLRIRTNDPVTTDHGVRTTAHAKIG